MKISLLIISCLFILSCNGGDGQQTVTFSDEYEIVKESDSSAKVTYKLLGTDGFGWAGIWRCICSGSDCMHGPPGGDDKDFFDCLSKGCNISLKDDSITCVSTGCNQCALLIGINHPLPIVTQ